MPNLKRQPRKAISSKGIWPVERKATDSRPCFSWMPLSRVVKTSSACAQPTGTFLPEASRSRGGGAIGGIEEIERLPTFRAGHAEVHRVAGLGAEVDRVAVFVEVELEVAAGRAVAADRGGGGVGFEARGDFSQAEVAGFLDQVGGQRAGGLLEELGKHGWAWLSKQGACGGCGGRWKCGGRRIIRRMSAAHREVAG